jgi:hypothetical protein
MGSSAWMPGWRPWKVDYADSFAVSDMAAVVVSFFDRVDSVERMVGDPGVGGASSFAAPASRFEGLTRGQLAGEFSEVIQGFFRAEARHFSANDDDAWGCRNPLEGVVVVILSVIRLRVKTLDLAVSTVMAPCVVALLGASSWSPDTTLFCFNVFVDLFFLFFIFDLLCKSMSNRPPIFLPRKTRVEGPVFTFHRPKTRPS